MPAVTVTDLNNAKLDLDHVAAIATSAAADATDRFGRSKRTLSGALEKIDADAAVVLSGLGYAPPVAYAAGIILTAVTQTVSYAGEVYAPKQAELPFTTSGAFETAKFRLIQGVAGADLAASGGSALVGHIPRVTAAPTIPVQVKLRERVAITDLMSAAQREAAFSHTSTADLSSLMQGVIDWASANGGGAVIVPNGNYLGNLTLKNGVILQSENAGVAGIKWGTYGIAQLVAYSSAAPTIDTPATGIQGGIYGLSISGGAHTGGFAPNAVRIRDMSFGGIGWCNLTYSANEALLVEAGVALDFTNMLVTDALKTRARASRTGAVTIGGTDHYLYGIEAQVGNQNFGGLSDANRYLAALHIKGANHFVTSCIGELSDVGIVNDSNNSSFVACRGDLNNAEGYILNGSAQWVGCRAITNSSGNSGLYSGWVISGQSNKLIGCTSAQPGGGTTKYSFENTGVYSAINSRTRFADCLGIDYLSSEYYYGANPPAILGADGFTTSVTLSSGANTLDARGMSYITVNEAPAASSIETITGGVPGQQLVIATDTITTGGITIPNNWFSGTGKMRTKAEPGTKTLDAKRGYLFIFNGGFWQEL